MYGSNYLGQPYYGQGPAVGTVFTLQTVSASVNTSASISFVLLINKTVSATVTTVAAISRQFGRTVDAAVTTAGTFATAIVKALNIRRATTKLLSLVNSTRSLNSLRETKELNLTRFTKDTADE